MRLIADELKHAYKHHLTSELEQIHSLVRELRVAVDGQGEQGDFLACQFADLARSKDRPVTRAELEALEKRVVELMRPSLDAVTELQYASGLGAGAAVPHHTTPFISLRARSEPCFISFYTCEPR